MPPAAREPAAAPAARILVVEDERVVARSLGRQLEHLGYTVVGLVPSGEEAVQQAGQLRPDLVLMDIYLEGQLDGVEAADEIRKRFRLPVVYLTAYSNQEILERAKVTLPCGYILKPFEDRELQVVVEVALYRHRMERIMEERERWCSALLRSIGDSVLATDPEGRVTYLNPAAERLTGWAKAEAEGQAVEAVFTLVNEESGQPVEGPVRRALRERTNVTLSGPAVLRARDGSARSVADCAAPIIDEENNARGVVLVWRDTTSEKEAERRTRFWAEQQRRIADAAVRMVLPVSTGARAQVAAETARELLGARHAVCLLALSSASVPELVAAAPGQTPADAAGLTAPLTGRDGRQLGVIRVSDKTEGEFTTADEALLTQLAHLTSVALENARLYQQAQEEIHFREHTEARKAAILDSALDAVITIDGDGMVTEFNTAAERMFGYPRDQVLGRRLAEVLLPPRYRQQHAEGLAHYLRSGEARILGRRVELAALHRDGTEFPVELTVTRVNFPGPPLFTGYVRDLTERNRLAQRLRETEAQFRQSQKMEVVGRLASGVAHDFNNLLTVINACANELLHNIALEDPMRSVMASILTAGERATLLTRQLLTFSRKQPVNLEVLDLNAVLADTEKLLRRMIGEDVILTTAYAPGLHHVKADRGQLAQLVMNLAVNARDAMPRGGLLTIATRNGEGDPKFSGPAAGRHVVLTVTDTGSGMDEATLAHVFEPFFTTKEVGRGTGLGLATVHGIVEQCRGQIQVRSNVGKGTTFTILLPATPEPLTPTATTPATPARKGTETILLAEDDAAVRTLFAATLRARGYTILEAKDGREATALFAQHADAISLLITDVIMPHLGGRQVAERAAMLKPAIKVLFLSGYTDDAVVREGVLQSEVAFLQKPFALERLVEKVHELLGTNASKAGAG